MVQLEDLVEWRRYRVVGVAIVWHLMGWADQITYANSIHEGYIVMIDWKGIKTKTVHLICIFRKWNSNHIQIFLY